MPLPVPNLDDRKFQEIVNEARSRIPVHCPEWSDHNLSDPGITLIELFAWMTELILYRLNKVPEKNFVKFLELLGVTLNPASPATTELTFRLSAPLGYPVKIDRGTEVATRRTEAEEALVFTTDEELLIVPPVLQYFLVSHDADESGQLQGQLARLRSGEEPAAGGASRDRGEQGVALFQETPQAGDTFYLGYTANAPIRNQVLAITMDFGEQQSENLGQAGVGIVPTNPPLQWEYWDGAHERWMPFEHREDADAWLEMDGTMGLTQPGQVILHVPGTASLRTLAEEDDREAYWVRCVNTHYTREQGAYYRSPRLESVLTQSIGGTARASNAYRVPGEVLGISNGAPGQSLRVSHTPMLPLQPGEMVQVESDNGWEDWSQVEDFTQSNPDDRHFVCDPVAGDIHFGPVVRSPEGEEVRYGATPPPGRHVRLSSYRYGGGPAGNVARDTITVPKASIPYIDGVTNRRAATGGAEAESLEQAKMRGPQVIRNLQRAVTPQDFEDLARAASTSVGRAHCIRLVDSWNDGGDADPSGPLSTTPQVQPGVVQVLIVPALSRDEQLQFTPRQLLDQLQASDEVLRQVRQYLDERRLLTTRLVVGRPDYVWVSVDARVKVRPGADHNRVKDAVENRLYEFIHPLWGGYDGSGWPFGRGLFLSELYSQIQSAPGVEYTDRVDAYPVDPSTGRRVQPSGAEPVPGTAPAEDVAVRGPSNAPQVVSVQSSDLLCSWYHNVTCF